MFFFYQIHFLTSILWVFRKSSGGIGIVIPVKKCHRNGKHRNPEDSCRNYQPRIELRDCLITFPIFVC
jgi:hypothetical protein